MSNAYSVDPTPSTACQAVHAICTHSIAMQELRTAVTFLAASSFCFAALTLSVACSIFRRSNSMPEGREGREGRGQEEGPVRAEHGRAGEGRAGQGSAEHVRQ